MNINKEDWIRRRIKSVEPMKTMRVFLLVSSIVYQALQVLAGKAKYSLSCL